MTKPRPHALDPGAAWQWATAAVAANREVLLALAGVFFLLPRLAMGLLGPEPAWHAGMQVAQVSAAMSAYYLAATPWLVPITVLEAVGTLAMLTLMTDAARPTVGDAIRAAALRVVAYLAAEVLFMLVFAFGGGLVMGAAALTGVAPLAALAFAAALAALVYGFVRLILLAPVIAVERIGQPLHALARAWRLTRGNTLRLTGLLALLALVAAAMLTATIGIVGSGVALAFGADAGKTGGTVIEAVLETAFAVYFVGIRAAVHRQLAGRV